MLVPVKPPSELPSGSRLSRRLGLSAGFSIVGALIIIGASAVDHTGNFAGVVALAVVGAIGPAASVASYRFTQGRLAAVAVGLLAAALMLLWLCVALLVELDAAGSSWG
jgi:hypothetical protein